MYASFFENDAQPLVGVGETEHVNSAHSLIALMGGVVWGSVERNGTYGEVESLTVAILAAHFAGAACVAIRGVSGSGSAAASRFLAWDIDERAPQRLPVLAMVLGRHNLLREAIGTTGSDSGRAKVVVFTTPLPALYARDLARGILEECRAESEWGIEYNKSESRPTLKTGGILRIGGRNIKRHGRSNPFFSSGRASRVRSPTSISPTITCI